MAGASGDAIKAGEAFVELNADDRKFRSILDKNAARFRKFAAGLRNVGVGAVALGSTILAPLVGATVASLKLLDSINDISERTNSSAESVSRLAYAAKLSASSIEDVEAANKVLTRSTLAAKDGSEEQAAAFKKMGITAEDFLELEMDEKFLKIAQGLDQLTTQEEKARFLTALLGKSAANLIPLLSEGEDGLRKLFAEAEELGAVVKSEDAKKAAIAMDNFDKVLTSLKATMIEVGLSVLSLGDNTEDGLKTAMLYLKMVRDWIKENKKLVAIVAIVGATLVVVGIAGVALGIIISGLVIIFKGFVAILSVVAFFFSPIGLLVIAIAAGVAVLVVQLYYLGKAFFETTELGQKLARVLGDSFKRMGEVFKLAFEGIFAALGKGDFDLVGKILSKTFEIAWMEIKLLSFEAIMTIINFLMDGFDDAIMVIKVNWIAALTTVKKFVLQLLLDIMHKLVALANAQAALLKEIGIDVKIEVIGKPIADLMQGIQTAIDKLEKDKIKVQAEVIAEVDKAKEQRALIADFAIKDMNEKIGAQKFALKNLVVQAQLKQPDEKQFPIAPMPHAPPKRDKLGRPINIDATINTLGDSAKGVFSSADYQSSLALGEANSVAKRQLEINKGVLDELKAARRDAMLDNKQMINHLAAIDAKVGFGNFV